MPDNKKPIYIAPEFKGLFIHFTKDDLLDFLTYLWTNHLPVSRDNIKHWAGKNNIKVESPL